MTAGNPPVARLQLGQLLRELRENAGMKRDAAAARLECQTPKISKIETGKATLSPGDVRLLIELYEVSPETAETVTELARQARKRNQNRVPDWAQRFVALESMANDIRTYENELVPGLLQTEDYARAIAEATARGSDAEQVDRLVAVREERQARLSSDSGPNVWAVINEAALRRPVGGAPVMANQLKHLRELATVGRITIQILPFSAGAHAAMGSSFVLLGMREPAGTKLVYIDDLANSDYLDGPSQVEQYDLVFERLQVAALGEAETAAMLDQTISEYA